MRAPSRLAIASWLLVRAHVRAPGGGGAAVGASAGFVDAEEVSCPLPPFEGWWLWCLRRARRRTGPARPRQLSERTARSPQELHFDPQVRYAEGQQSVRGMVSWQRFVPWFL